MDAIGRRAGCESVQWFPLLYDYQAIQCFVFIVKTNERALLIVFCDEATTIVEAAHSLSTAFGVCLGVFGGGVSTHNLFGFASSLRE